MNRIAEALKYAVQIDDPTRLRHVVRDNLTHIVKALEKSDEIDAAIMATIFGVATYKTNAYAPAAPINRVDLAHDCFNLENPDG